jgi:hypothetical protein
MSITINEWNKEKRKNISVWKPEGDTYGVL